MRPKSQKAPAGAFWRSSLMHFYSGTPMHFYSGVDIDPIVGFHTGWYCDTSQYRVWGTDKLGRAFPVGLTGGLAMRSPAILAATVLVGAIVAPPGFAQTTLPLAYVQPLPPQSVQMVQDRLRQAGAYPGAVDGVWGPDSEAALQRFQQTHQLQVTGQMNEATAATLGIDPGSLLAMAQPPAPPPRGGDMLRDASVRAIQSRLRALGFYGGAEDGVWGPSTQVAIERFQQGRGLQPNGQLDPATIAALGLAPDVLIYR